MRPSSRWTPYLLVGPAVLFFAFVVGLPLLGTIWLSFTKWSGTNRMRFIGIDNFTRAIHDTVYQRAYLNTFIYIAATLVLEVAVGFALAGLVSIQGKRTLWYRITFFIPVMLPMVVIAVLWSFVYSDDGGLINSFLTGIGHMDAMGLHPASIEGLEGVLRRHDNVERVLCGHLHRSITRRFASTVAMTAPSCAHAVALDLHPGITPGTWNREPPAVALHRWSAEGGVVSHLRAVGEFPTKRFGEP